jgi:hypothetical protein
LGTATQSLAAVRIRKLRLTVLNASWVPIN